MRNKCHECGHYNNQWVFSCQTCGNPNIFDIKMEPKTIKLMAEYYGITENTMYNILTAMQHDQVERAIEYVKSQTLNNEV